MNRDRAGILRANGKEVSGWVTIPGTTEDQYLVLTELGFRSAMRLADTEGELLQQVGDVAMGIVYDLEPYSGTKVYGIVTAVVNINQPTWLLFYKDEFHQKIEK